MLRWLLSLLLGLIRREDIQRMGNRVSDDVNYQMWKRKHFGKRGISISLFNEATRLLKDGLPDHEVQFALMRQGVEPDIAFEVVQFAREKLN